jgi:hypothetical protein
MSPTIGRVSDANDDDRCSSQEAMNKIEEFYFYFLVTSELQQYFTTGKAPPSVSKTAAFGKVKFTKGISILELL